MRLLQSLCIIAVVDFTFALRFYKFSVNAYLQAISCASQNEPGLHFSSIHTLSNVNAYALMVWLLCVKHEWNDRKDSFIYNFIDCKLLSQCECACLSACVTNNRKDIMSHKLTLNSNKILLKWKRIVFDHISGWFSMVLHAEYILCR